MWGSSEAIRFLAKAQLHAGFLGAAIEQTYFVSAGGWHSVMAVYGRGLTIVERVDNPIVRFTGLHFLETAVGKDRNLQGRTDGTPESGREQETNSLAAAR